MPIYTVQAPDGNIYKVEAPEGATQEQIFGFVGSQMAMRQRAPESAGFNLGDLAASFAQSAYGSTQALTDVFGAGNVASRALEERVRASQAGMSVARQAELARQQERLKRAEASGSALEEAKAVLQNIAEAPLQSAAQALGSFAPYIPTMFLGPAAGVLGLGARATAAATNVAKAAPAVIGTAQGAGAVKGAIYDAVYEAERKDGVGEEEARAKAEAAQSYAGNNIDQILLGSGAGYVAGRFGAERLLTPGAAAKASQSVAGRIATAAATDVPTEAFQGGQERLAANLALQREGRDVPTFEGVAGQATQEGLLGLLGSAPVAALRGPDVEALRQEAIKKQQAEFEAEKARALAEMAARPPEPEKPIELPQGYKVMREELGREVGPESYGIFVEGQETPLTTVASEQQALQKIESFKEIRESERETLVEQMEKLNDGIQKTRDRIDYLEATGKTADPEYTKLKTALPDQELAAETKARELAEQVQQLGAPLTFAPIGQKETVREQYNVLSPTNEPLGTFATAGEAEASVRGIIGDEPFKQAEMKKQRDERIVALEQQLVPKLKQFGLQDVGLKVVESIENNAGGAYLNKLIRVAYDEANPLQTMRHESLHALKDLGFFTPQQWKALNERAEKQWVQELKNVPFSEGKSRHDAYVEMFTQEGEAKGLSGQQLQNYVRETLNEEAIADAFGAYDRGATPPPGMIAALFKRLKNFFLNFGQALRGAGFESADDIFQRVERGELRGRKPAEAEEKLSLAPKGIPQKIWDLHEKVIKADDEASGRVGRPQGISPGAAKRNQTMTFRRLNQAVMDFVGGDEQKANDLMVKMNEESSRRGREAEEKAEEVIDAKQKYSLAGAGVNRSTRNLMEQTAGFAQIALGLKTDKVKGATGANNVRDVGKALNQYTTDHFGAIDKSNPTAQDVEDLAKAVADEVGYQLRASAKTGTGLGWYSNNYPNAVKRLGNRFNELKENKHARSVFSALVAVTSNGEDVTANIKNAIRLYSDLRQGKPLVPVSSRRADALTNNLVQIQSLLDKHGKGFEEELTKEITVSQMNAYLRSVGEEPSSDYLANTKIPAAAIYFGPKLGAFYANLSGSEGYLTMDLWWTRSINRMRGLLVPQATPNSINTFRELMEMPSATREEVIAATVPFKKKYEQHGYVTDLEFLAGAKEPNKAGYPKWLAKAKRKAGPAFEQLMLEHRLEKLGNTIYKNEYEMLKEDPFNSSDRKFMYDVARKAQKNLRSEGIDLSLADIQAALWYYEKRLYAKLTGREADDIGYEEAIIAQSTESDRREGPSVVFDEQPDRRDESRGKGAVPDESGRVDASKLSLKKGIVAEVAPNPDHISAELWREMTPQERIDATKAVASKIMLGVFSELGLRGYSYQFSSGKYEGELNPNIIVEAPEDATIQELDELARVLGYVLDQKAMVTFDENNKTSGSQAGFVQVVIPNGMKESDVNELRNHIARSVPQAGGDTLRNGSLFFGNFSAYDDRVDTLTDKQYHQAIVDAINEFDYVGDIEVYEPMRFHSDLVEASKREDYLEGTRYGERDTQDLQAERDTVRGQGRKRLEAIAESAIALRDRWIDARGAARQRGGERGNEIRVGDAQAEYGTPRANSVSAVGVHFSKQQRPIISTAFYGSGLRGMERDRLMEPKNSDIRSRAYFYVDKGRGIIPESGVGGVPHVIKLNNLYDVLKDPLGIVKRANGETAEERRNNWERGVKEAGFDGYLLNDPLQHNGYAVLVGKHDVKTSKSATRYSLKGVAFPSVKAVKEAVAKTEVPTTREFRLFNGANRWLDKDGKAKVFYHATAREFFEFTPAGQSQAIFLADTPEEAETFGSIAEDRLRREIYKALNKAEKLDFFQRVVDEEVKKGSISEREGTDFIKQANRKVPDYGDFGDIEAQVYAALLDLSPTRMSIMPLYARAETPFDFENSDHVNLVMDWVARNTQIPQDFPEKWLAGMKGRISQGLWQAIEDKRVQQAIRALGFDAFTVRENRASPKNYAVYKPEQLKSVTGNLGDYGLETKDIRYSLKNVRYSDNRFEKLWNESMYTQNDAENKTKGYLAFVDPMDFVRATASPETFERLLQEQEPLDPERMRNYDQVPFLSVSEKNGEWKITGHEGRHRMLALHGAGYNEVPIYIHLRAEDAKSIPVKMLTAQYPDSVSSVLMAAEVEPLSYANKDKAMEKFTRMSSKVKYSLPAIPKAMETRIGETTFRREPEGFFERMTEAISPKNFSYFRQRVLNQYNQLGVYDRKLVEQMGGKELLADQSAEAAALMSDLGAGVAASAMGFGDRNGGIPVYKNGVTTIDRSKKGLIAILQPLARYGDPKIYQYYQYWAMVKRGVRLNAEGKETGIDNTDVQYAKYLQDKFPEFVTVQKEFIEFNNGLVKYARDTGVISEQNAEAFMRYADYVPFYRQMDGETTVGPNIFQSIAGVKPPKKLKGGTAPLADFLETAVRNTQSMIQAGVKNAAAQRAVGVVTKVKAPGMGAERLDHDANGPDVFHVLENGKRVSYRTPDALLIDAISSLHLNEIPGLGIIAAPANALRNLVTKDPGFMMANLMRDSLSAWVTSGQKMTPIAGTVINFGKALAKKSKGYEALLDAGVIGGYEFSQNIERSGRQLEEDLSEKAGKKAPLVLRPFKSLWGALERGTEASDAATRALVYERVLNDTGNEAEALFRALEVMNFNRKGNSPLVRILTAGVPFLNARMQGLDLFYRASTGNMNMADKAAIQRKFWLRGSTMMAISAYYWMMVHDEDDYKSQEQETKDNNWIIPSLGIRIPIPFEVGVLFKTIPERIMAYSFGNDTGKDFTESMKRNFMSTFAFNPIPQVVKPVLETAFNFNPFTWRQIVGQGMQDVAAEYQVGPGTSKIAKAIGENLGLSPMKVDHIIKGYTGTMGMYAIDTIDYIMDQFGDSPKAAKRFEQMPVIKRFAVDPAARGTVTAYYEMKDSVDTTVRTMNLLERTMEPEKFAQYVQDNLGPLAVKDYIRDLEKTMKELREMRVVIQSSTMSAEEKRDGLLTINQAENNLTKNIQEVKKAIASLK